MDFNAWKFKLYKMTKGHLAVQEIKRREILDGVQQVIFKYCFLNRKSQNELFLSTHCFKKCYEKHDVDGIEEEME